MSVTRTSSPTTTTAASTRLSRAIAASKQPEAGTKPSPTTTRGERGISGAKAAPGTPARSRADRPADHSHDIVAAGVRRGTERVSTREPASAAPRDALRGANAAPAYEGSAAAAAGQGERNVMSVPPTAAAVGASAGQDQPYTPYQASSDTYAYYEGMEAPAVDDAPAAANAGQLPGTGAWNARWQERFEQLQLAPADVAYLARAGYTEQELRQIAAELGEVPVLDADPAGGSVASADGPTARNVAPLGQPGTATDNAWSPEWERRFGDLMQRMGMSKLEIEAQLQGVQGQPTSEAQLAEAYRQMEASLGAFDEEWRSRFGTLMKELETPAAEQEQVLQQLAGSGMTESQLTEAYTRMEASKPAWNKDWETKFRSLDVPADMVSQLRDSGAPKEALEQQFQHLLDTRMAYTKDGRLERLEDAKATPEEKWGVMLEGKDGKEFDKLVEQIHSSHVSGWKRVGSFALNLIPGVYAIQYATGKDWVTGEKIDRSNPLNVVGAVASGFAGFTAVRSAIQGVQGLSAASRAANATMQAAGSTKGVTGLAASVEAMGAGSALGKGSLQAIEAAGLVTKFEKGLRFSDYLKSAVPIVNRFGEAGRLSAVGRGYTQGMQLAAGSAALRNVSGGGVAVDKATRATVLAELKQGKGIQEALAAAGRTGRAGDAALDAAHVARDFNRYGFLQGSVTGRLGVGTGSGNFRLNPFRSGATISSTANPNVLALGRTVNFGSTGGLAQGLGAVRGANAISNPGLYAQAASRAADANRLAQNGAMGSRLTGLHMADDVQRVETITRTSEWASRLGVAGGSKFRSLLQLGGSNRAATRIAGVVENGGSSGYRAARHAGDAASRLGGFVAMPLVGGAVVGMTGRQMQPGWDYLKDRREIQRTEAEARVAAEREQQELERLYREQHAAGTSAGADALDGAATSTPATGDAAGATVPATEPWIVGTSPTTGGQLMFDPALGMVYDATNGDVYDPETGQLVGNLNQAQAGQAAAAPATGGAGGEVYVDPQTGYYVDPATGLMADPATGNVYDPRSGEVVGTVDAQPTQ